MKRHRIFRTVVAAIILSLVMVAIPASPAGAQSITLNPDKGPPGTLVTVTGTGFTMGSLVDVRFDAVSKGFVQMTGTSTAFSKTFTVPQKDPGQYVVQAYDWSGETAFLMAQAIFTITGLAEITIDPDEGPVDTEVEISGEGFDSQEDIEVFWDDTSDELDIIDGDEETDGDGEFFDTLVLVPEATAGEHKIIVKGKDSGSEAEAEFTVEPKITIDPTSGSSGVQVTVSGTGFGRRSDITISFNKAGVSISGEDTTDRDGSFTATFTVPEVAPGTYDVEVEDDDNNDAKAQFTMAGKISIDPVQGNIGTTVTVTGSGFKVAGGVIINYDNIQVATAVADASGAFSTSFAVPMSTKGPHTVTVTDGLNTLSATFEALSSASLDKGTGNVGTELTASGTGFSGQVNIKYDDNVVATTTADAGGAFSATFPAPQSTKGDHTVTISDGTNTITQTFTMESDPPPIPKLLTPEPDTKVKKEEVFDWEDSNDPSQPVTYTFQIAKGKDFTKESIVLERTELTKSEYTVTENDKLEPAKKDAPYYWRVKATDGAANEGEWSEPQSFYSGGFTFSITGWLLYLIMALGAIVIFIFGLWVGRRTAYY